MDTDRRIELFSEEGNLITSGPLFESGVEDGNVLDFVINTVDPVSLFTWNFNIIMELWHYSHFPKFLTCKKLRILEMTCKKFYFNRFAEYEIEKLYYTPKTQEEFKFAIENLDNFQPMSHWNLKYTDMKLR